MSTAKDTHHSPPVLCSALSVLRREPGAPTDKKSNTANQLLTYKTIFVNVIDRESKNLILKYDIKPFF